MCYPSLKEVKVLSEKYNRIPISLEIYSDFKTPISLLNQIRKNYNKFFLFESIEGGERLARYTFIGFDPSTTFKANKGRSYLEKEGIKKEIEGNPLEALKQLLKERVSPSNLNLPPLTGGAVGYFGYETVGYVEKIDFNTLDELETDDITLMFCDKIIAFDHLKQKIYLIVNLEVNGQCIDTLYAEAVQTINQLYKFIQEEQPTHNEVQEDIADFKSEETKESYMEKVERAKEYIRNGDIFQVVLSQRFKAKFNTELFDVYRTLRTINPSPYMYLIKIDDLEIAGASPETLVRVKNRSVTTMPIAGTRKRGLTIEEDVALEKNLLADEKELAEHNMLVDLGRNDVGKISEFGSVRLEKYQKVQRFSHVMHLTSEVVGTLREDFDAIDALKSILPAGTLSGAPKVRAMEIIEELERTRRGIYGGGIGYISYDGNMDTCIAIRTIIKSHDTAYIQTGAGIVLDSDPAAEYEETLAKANAMFKAVRKVREIR